MTRARTTGLVLGKFMPPHAGHLYLVEFAKRFVDDLTVVVGTLAREPIPGALRYEWMVELCPGARVVHLTDENPQEPSEHPDFWEIWKRSLLRVLGSNPDYVFASEDYGAKLAEVLGATFVPLDLPRAALPISGTAVRANPLAHWEYLPAAVRPYFVKRVCVFGPESTGKTTLAKQLADHFEATVVPEYARTWLERGGAGGSIAEGDLLVIARGQRAMEDALARAAKKLLVCDTDLLSTAIWSDALFDRCEPWIRQEAERRRYDLYLLLDVDVPWVADNVRYLPNERRTFFDACKAALDARGRPYVVVRGSWEERLRTAIEAVSKLLVITLVAPPEGDAGPNGPGSPN